MLPGSIRAIGRAYLAILSSSRSLPEGQQRVGEALGLDAVRRVEWVAFGERLDREVGEDGRQPVRHAGVVVGVAATAEREVQGPIERSKRLGVQAAFVERFDESSGADRVVPS